MCRITASQVKELREATNVGMMDCKRALTEAGGDFDVALRLLRERGVVFAGKKADRSANEGLVSAEVLEGGKLGVIIEVNCETDFVARNETFQAFVADLLERSKTLDGALAESCQDELVAKIAEIGENLIIRRNDRFEVQATGTAASYIHLGGKIGVLLEIGCEDDASLENDRFKEVVKDVTLHIAAAKPDYLDRDEVPADVVSSEREIFAKQAEGKPDNIVEKIVDGKMEKFYATQCLVEQGFVKDPDQSIGDLLADCGKEIGDTLSIRRYRLYQIGA
jgi:elongation factor Ts